MIEELNRPTFKVLPEPLAEICRYIAFSTLKERVAAAKALVHFLKPDFLR